MTRPVTAQEREVVQQGNSRFLSIDTRYWNRPENRANPELAVKYLSDLARVSGHGGDAAAAFAAIIQCKEKIAAVQRKPATFRNCRADVADFMADMLQLGAAAEALLRFVPDGKPVPGLRAAASRMKNLERDFADLIKPAADWLAGTGPVSAIENADLGIVLKFSFLCSTAKEDGDQCMTILETLDATRRLAQQAGLKAVAIPDLAFGMLESRPDHILSFHTAGLLPNFTHFKRGDLPGFMVLDPGGYSGWSSLSGASLADLDLPPLAEAQATHKRLWADIVKANVSKYEQDGLDEAAEPLPQSYVFVPLQVATDRTQAMARIDMYTMLDIVIARFKGTDTKVVVKPHPKSSGLDHLARIIVLGESGDLILRYDSIHRLIAGAKAVITVNSGVGSEAMLHGKPIYCFGAADYDPIAHHISSAADFTDLTSPIRPAVSQDDLTRFVAYYRNQYLVEWTRAGRMDAALQSRVIDPILALRR